MMDLIVLAETCEKYEYCTNCSKRKGCPIRSKFYSEEEYMESIKSANLNTSSFAIVAGYDFSSIADSINQICNEMDKKRKCELELHPTYSFD